jgi:hypothetical protein
MTHYYTLIHIITHNYTLLHIITHHNALGNYQHGKHSNALTPGVGQNCVRYQFPSNVHRIIYAYGGPRAKSPQTGPINFPLNSQPPIPHLNARCLILCLNQWHLLEFWHFGELCRAQCLFCTHFIRCTFTVLTNTIHVVLASPKYTQFICNAHYLLLP